MRPMLFVCALLLTLPPYGRAADAPAPTETVIRMKVRPAPAPKPALKYQLLPELREMNPGNPIQAYSLCFAEQHNFWHNKEAVEKREKWQTMPLHDLPLKEMQYYKGTNALRQADYAARLDTPDWQILLQFKRDGLLTLIPDIQQLHELAGALKVRFRIEIAERRFDAALITAKTMLGLSRHLGEHPTLIGEQVGSAIANLAIGPLDEMIQQPGSPNLFWALTDLPYPFIDLRQGVQGERIWLTIELQGLDEQKPMTEAEMRKIVDRLRKRLKGFRAVPGTPTHDERDWLNARTRDENHVRAARKRLAEYGLAEDTVKEFPALQVVLLDQKYEEETRRDEGRKTMALPYWQAASLLASAPTRKNSKDSLFGWLGLDYGVVKMTQARLDQRLGLLRCVEALRMYAAEHNGKLPAKLDDIKLPLPVDAITGKPFVYELKGDTAILRGTPPPGQEKIAAYNVRYEVTIAK